MMRYVWFSLCVLWPGLVTAQDGPLRYNSYGAPGLIDMPAASSAPDAELAFSLSSFAGQSRATASFQVTPRLSASLRYADLHDVRGQEGALHDTIRDRSLSLHYRLIDERQDRPALAIEVSDFLGTGIYAGEYLVATKAVRPDLSATLGLGWGRLAGVGGFASPFGLPERPTHDTGQGGTLSSLPFFQGDTAFFGGLHWQPHEQLGLVLEYSADAYPFEHGSAFTRRSPLNVGLTYAPRPDLQLSAHYLYGSEFGFQLSYRLNPLHPPAGSGYDLGPPPVRPREAGTHPSGVDRARLARALAAEGLILRSVSRAGPQLGIAIENTRYQAAAQAVGRAARVLSVLAPSDVTQFAIAMTENGLSGPAVILPRAMLERSEFRLTGSADSRVAAYFAPHVLRDAGPLRPEWGISPYITPNLFDPDDPLRADFGLAVHGRWEVAPRVVVRGTLRQRLAGNLDQTTRTSDSELPRVRSDFRLYDREGDADVNDLTLAFYAQPVPQFTIRLTLGVFETMFAGVSAEVLWRPPDSDLAFGVELNALQQRDYDGGFGLRDYRVLSGHGSAYWQFGSGYTAQVDLGRYLAGDWGGTLHLSRRFANGWALGAFMTLTDVPFDRFGEGSFDKGITLTVPLSWISGQARRDAFDTTLRPVTRDGGARVIMRDRLYDMTQPLSRDAIGESWGRFWR
ncbi:YjbH domain-containing protein [Loktanella agnita]|uniref:YjbH domain-containing protein n=1 Tax=Loktanella agnita TaxID=287097 RepID=UPI0039862240